MRCLSLLRLKLPEGERVWKGPPESGSEGVDVPPPSVTAGWELPGIRERREVAVLRGLVLVDSGEVPPQLVRGLSREGANFALGAASLGLIATDPAPEAVASTPLRPLSRETPRRDMSHR
jgi:hypothetical protein